MNNLEVLLAGADDLQSDSERDEYVSSLTEMLEKCDEAEANGSPIVSDDVYNTLKEYLRKLDPNSSLFDSVWSKDEEPVNQEFDKHLIKHPMKSIETVKSLDNTFFLTFEARLDADLRVPVVASMKENGHGINVIYKNGYLVHAHTRGRSSNGRDITRIARIILEDYNEELADLGVVDIRGELVIRLDELEKARIFNPTIKSAFTAVASLSRDSAGYDEAKLLHFVAYNIFADNREFELLSEKFEFLENSGFETPLCIRESISGKTFRNDFQRILSEMESYSDSYEYYTDGVVLALDNIELFDLFGENGHATLGNLAIKMGKWEQVGYTGVIDHIDWKNGKGKKTPVAVLNPPVLTSTGNTVTNVPMYAPCYILMLEAYKGRILHFKYGGEAGVVPCTSDGRLITNKDDKGELKKMLNRYNICGDEGILCDDTGDIVVDDSCLF